MNLSQHDLYPDRESNWVHAYCIIGALLHELFTLLLCRGKRRVLLFRLPPVPILS